MVCVMCMVCVVSMDACVVCVCVCGISGLPNSVAHTALVGPRYVRTALFCQSHIMSGGVACVSVLHKHACVCTAWLALGLRAQLQLCPP